MIGTTQLASRVDQMWPLGLGVVGVVEAVALVEVERSMALAMG